MSDLETNNDIHEDDTPTPKKIKFTDALQVIWDAYDVYHEDNKFGGSDKGYIYCESFGNYSLLQGVDDEFPDNPPYQKLEKISKKLESGDKFLHYIQNFLEIVCGLYFVKSVNEYLIIKDHSTEIHKVENNINEGYKNAQNLEAEIRKIHAEAEQLNINHALKGFKSLYSREAMKQSKDADKYLFWAKIFAFILLASIFLCFVFNVCTKNTSWIIYANEITFNLVLLSICLWCIKLYSLARSLNITYTHKSMSCDALLSFVAAVNDDHNIKNTILLESSRMIFSIPETNLAKKDALNLKLLETFKDISQTSK